ncbi:MAG: hypothetical protein ABFS28_00505 [Bacteroidota bacterium]
MKTTNLFLPIILGMFLMVSGCSKEEFGDIVPEDLLNDQELADGNLLKGAHSGKTVTIKAFARLSAVSDPSLPQVTCIPAAYGFTLSSGGNISGNVTFQGRINEELSTYVIDDCMFTGPTQMVVNGHGVMTGMNGDSYNYIATYLYDLSDLTFTGTVDLTDGTGRFEGASGHFDMYDGVKDPEGSNTWKAEGTFTLLR